MGMEVEAGLELSECFVEIASAQKDDRQIDVGKSRQRRQQRDRALQALSSAC